MKNKNKSINFGLLNQDTFAKLAATGAAGGALWGVGYGLTKPVISNEELDMKDLAQEVAANAGGGAISTVGLHYGGNLLSKIKFPSPRFSNVKPTSNFAYMNY